MDSKSKIFYRYTSLCLTVAIILPFATALASIFLHEQHEHCTETATVHFHKKEADCSLCDFQITPVVLLESSDEENLVLDNYKNIISSYPSFFQEYNSLLYYLRGPPIAS